jgi:hypothetical protein
MVIIQLDTEQLSTLLQNIVRKAISEIPQQTGNPETNRLLTIKQAGEVLGRYIQSNGKRESFLKNHKKSNHKKNKGFPKPSKLLSWLIKVFFVFVLRLIVNNYTLESPNQLQHTPPPTVIGFENFSQTNVLEVIV